jgi:putative hydrolase of the HAD superfamily
MPKPAAETYERFFDAHGVDPARAAMFEDIAHNLAVPHARGMKTVLVTPKAGAHDHREDWEIAAGAKATHVDYLTQDLAGFLFGLGFTGTAPAP